MTPLEKTAYRLKAIMAKIPNPNKSSIKVKSIFEILLYQSKPRINMKELKKIKIEKLRAGFSLIELLIVIVILGGLVAVVAPGLMDSADQAKRDTVCLRMNGLKKRRDMFKHENGVYPDTEDGFEALTSNPDAEK